MIKEKLILKKMRKIVPTHKFDSYPGKIEYLRLSFIWTKTFYNFLGQNVKDDYPYKFFVKLSDYKKKFNELHQLRKSEEECNSLSLPWEIPHPIRFWEYHFGGIAPRDLSPNHICERYMLPFREHVKAQISTSSLKDKGTVSLEGFYHRHGVTLVITVKITNSYSLKEAVEKTMIARFKKIYKIMENVRSKGPYSLRKLANYLLDSFCQKALGKKEKKGLSFFNEPFSVATVIQGDSPYKKQPVEQGSSIHRALETLTNWTEIDETQKSITLDDKKLDIKNNRTNRCLYANKQGRAIWFPDLFTPSEAKATKCPLSHYHKNLVMASLYTASLGAFIAHTANLLKHNDTTTFYHRQCLTYGFFVIHCQYSFY